jgi:hypothetical protein
MESGALVPAFLLLAPFVLAIIDLLGTGKGTSSMGADDAYVPPLPSRPRV